MIRIRRLMAVAVVLLAARAASADGLDLHHGYDPPSYCPFRYWTPRLARCYDQKCGPKLNVYAPDRHPEIVPYCIILGFPQPAVPPAATLIERPTPPATSKFRYGPESTQGTVGVPPVEGKERRETGPSR